MSDLSVLTGLDDGSDQSTQLIKLISKDHVSYEIDRKSAYISKLIKTSLQSDPTSTELELTTSSSVLSAIIEYMRHHNGIEPSIVEKPLRSKQMIDVCRDAWDAQYIDKYANDRQYLYDIISAANYLDINSLLHLACAKVASLIKGMYNATSNSISHNLHTLLPPT